ncbi:hypothetical protein Poly30_02240 [Planctomycetes bacterium Poly30]|uniref:Uncharacterized protein n=1 Tax=Saltatorellus ferox TaxID=2528018 RepID=A0A518EL15_9BACT|nr:hypothetical protein Poly30_02240 [Planctomycetes bacterium Poly30]
MPCIVPLHLPSSLLVEGPDGKTALYADAQALGEHLDVSFNAKLRVRLELQGDASEQAIYELRGEAGTKTAGASARLLNTRLTKRSTAVEAEFPMPGAYRLYRAQRPAPTSRPGGLATASVPLPTEAIIEVVDETPVLLRIDAALRQGAR